MRIDTDSTYLTRDLELAEHWAVRRSAFADALRDFTVHAAETEAQYDLAAAKSSHAYNTAMPSGGSISSYGWAYDVWASGHESHALDCTNIRAHWLV